MQLSNYYNNLIKLSSITEESLVDLDSIKITGAINCCDTVYTSIIDAPTDTAWKINLDTAVKLDSNLTHLYVKHIEVGELFSVIPAMVDLSYVSANCGTEECTMETFSAHFAPIFKAYIDIWFTNRGIASNVTVTFSGNIMIVTSLPANFVIDSVKYGEDISSPSLIATPGYYGNQLDSQLFTNANEIFLTPAFFGLEKFVSGVYKITVRMIQSDNSYVEVSNCFFMDIDVKCKLAGLLSKLLSEATEKEEEKISTLAHMLHYALINGSNCGCNCEELCQVYKELKSILDENAQIIENCGC